MAVFISRSSSSAQPRCACDIHTLNSLRAIRALCTQQTALKDCEERLPKNSPIMEWQNNMLDTCVYQSEERACFVVCKVMSCLIHLGDSFLFFSIAQITVLLLNWPTCHWDSGTDNPFTVCSATFCNVRLFARSFPLVSHSMLSSWLQLPIKRTLMRRFPNCQRSVSIWTT